MRLYYTYFILSLSILLISCNQKIDGFDDDLWRKDSKGCNGNRKELVAILLKNKETLKKFDDDALSNLLGTPERNNQLIRGKKNYIYFIEPGRQCSNNAKIIEGKKLVIEFDALGKPRIIRLAQIDI
jgi:hypothetical protein